MIGLRIDDKYLIEEKLGEGGMGAVYRASRLLIGDAVAIKVLHSQQMTDTQVIERFRREAQAAARLKHPNVVTIHDFGVSRNNLVYLVMELVEGDSLRTLINQQCPIPLPATSEIISQVCAALDEAHRRNIVHRDLKPDNIIVTPSTTGLRVKVLDFGIAKLRDLSVNADTLTQTGTVLGTPRYMSPEQCMGEELDGRSDIYSLGVVIYEMLSGTLPFNSPSFSALIVQHVTQPPPLLRSANARVPPAVERTVMRSLEKRREARQQTADELARELRAAIGGSFSIETSEIDQVATRPLPPMATAPPHAVVPAAAPPTRAASVPDVVSIPQTRVTTSGKTPGRFVLLIIVAGLLLLTALGLVAWLLFARRDTVPSQEPVKAATPASDSKSKEGAVNPSGLQGEDKVLRGEALSESDVSGLPLSEISRLRNTIFARHGRIFQSSELQNYFASRPWYKPRTDYSDAQLTSNDRENVRLTQAAENRMGGAESVANVETAVNITATASSSRKMFRGIDYGPANALDGSMMTAWVEGTDGPGIGEWIRFDFGREVKLRRIFIAPGYYKSPQIWQKNNRLAIAIFHFSDGSTKECRFPDQMEEQQFETGDVTTSWVRIEIRQIYLADSDSQDTAISQVTFEWH